MLYWANVKMYRAASPSQFYPNMNTPTSTGIVKRAAIGIRMHSGWGSLVAVSSKAGVPDLIHRRRVGMTVTGTPGANQPYHFARNLGLPEAETFLGNCFADSKRLALVAIRDVAKELAGRQYRPIVSTVLIKRHDSEINGISVTGNCWPRTPASIATQDHQLFPHNCGDRLAWSSILEHMRSRQDVALLRELEEYPGARGCDKSAFARLTEGKCGVG